MKKQIVRGKNPRSSGKEVKSREIPRKNKIAEAHARPLDNKVAAFIRYNIFTPWHEWASVYFAIRTQFTIYRTFRYQIDTTKRTVSQCFY